MPPIDPLDLDGAPAVMPTNDWWKTGLDAAVAVTLAKVNRPLASNTVNPPPGSFRGGPQASSTPGANVAFPNTPAPWLWLGLALLIAGAAVFAVTRR